MSMLSLEDLFDVSDYKKGKKGEKGKAAPKDGGKGKKKKENGGKDKKGVRYPLPVRVRAGHVRCDLLKADYEGKTVSEAEVKNKIRACYPELSGVQMNLVKFDNRFTEMLENQEKYGQGKAGAEAAQEHPEEAGEGDGLEFASAEEDELQEESAEDGLEEEIMDSEETQDGDMEPEEERGEDAGKEIFIKGCWIKLEIHYEELAENQKVTYPVCVVAGSERMDFGDDTASMEEVREKWAAAHPEYENCLFHYDDRQGMLIPFVRGESEVKGKKYRLPLTVGYLNLTEHYDKEDFGEAEDGVTLKQIRELYARNHPEYDNAIFAFTGEGKYLFPVMNFQKEGTTDSYSLPIVVRGPGFKLELDPVDFKGQESATLEEIRGAIENVYPEFSKERTEMVYDERGFVVPILRGSKKGVRITSDRAGQNLFFTKGRDGRDYRIEQMPYGFFDCSVDGEDVGFHLSADKVPGRILEEVIAFFKQDPGKEAAVQIFYDAERKEYRLYYPPQKAESCSVVFRRNPELENRCVLMMDIHSHGCMRAFFSSVDDHDEKGTRLFMVVGRLDGDAECRLRAGIAGFYRNVPVTDLFDLEGMDDGI
ncbi:hypothetical protein [uncultured Acetatifactor sp.]|uniref:hypothetical protein n=1 Tax=uncultured Acetatifactor sp. TaxID=1671927 RepID=UPI0026F3C10B|nr:hypothetical protein [uncultured Acetatifactor sp.]